MNSVHPLRNTRSVSSRLTRMNLLVSGAVLLIAALAFFSYDMVTFRGNLIHNLDAEAQIVGENSVSALMFNDQESASDTLRGLERSPDVQAAILTTNDGTVFARYGSSQRIDLHRHTLADGQTNGVWTANDHVLVARRIMFQGSSEGVVYISATLREIPHRTRQYLLIVVVILIFCMTTALIISSVSRRLIAGPIISLSKTALLVSREKDYSVRARVEADSSEIAVLVGAFNTMLSQIQERDQALEDARSHLEARVVERTAELKAVNRELEAFSYTVAHDLRGPLDAMAGIAFLLKENYANNADGSAAPMLEQLQTSTHNMSALIDDLLDFARASTATLKTAAVDLAAIAREIAVELIAAEPERQVDFKIADVPVTEADAGLARVVMNNLLRNSWKYTSRHPHACIEFGSRVEFTNNQSSARVIYFVRDDGAGFDEAQMDKLFQPFQRMHGKAEFAGTGIGLATVQRILMRQGGEIWAHGAVEEGATFYFTIGASKAM